MSHHIMSESIILPLLITRIYSAVVNPAVSKHTIKTTIANVLSVINIVLMINNNDKRTNKSLNLLINPIITLISFGLTLRFLLNIFSCASGP